MNAQGRYADGARWERIPGESLLVEDRLMRLDLGDECPIGGEARRRGAHAPEQRRCEQTGDCRGKQHAFSGVPRSARRVDRVRAPGTSPDPHGDSLFALARALSTIMGCMVNETVIVALPPRLLLMTALPAYVPGLNLPTIALIETTTRSPSKLTPIHDVVALSTERGPRSVNVPNPTFDARAPCARGTEPSWAEKFMTLGSMPNLGGGLVTAKVTLIVALPPFALATVMVAV